MNKEWLEKQIKRLQEKRASLKKKGAGSDNLEEVRSIGDQVEDLDTQIAEFRSQLDAVVSAELKAADDAKGEEERAAAKGGQAPESLETRAGAGIPVGQAQVLATYGAGGQLDQRNTVVDPFGTVEYRQAFMAFARTGDISPALQSVQPEFRADAMTQTTDVTAVIPSTILNEVISQLKQYGQVFSRVRRLNIKGGVTVPILSLKPSATWIGQSSTSEKKKLTANTNVTFSYYGLECKVSTSLLADTVTLDGFEQTITDVIVEAMVMALDTAIIVGTGTGQPLGITVDSRVPVGNKVPLSAAEFILWTEWKKKVFAKMPLAYKAGATFFMASGTWEGYIDGMVDDNNQPVGRVNYGITEASQERFGGKEVVLVEDDIIANYDDASADDVVAIYCNLKNYGINSNMQMTMYRYLDHDTNEWIDKAILIADGKLIDPYGVVIVYKSEDDSI